MTLMYDNGVSKKNYLEVHLEYIPTNEVSPLGGGNIKMVAMRESVPFFKFGGYIGLTINTAKYELLFNDFYVNVVDAIEAKLNGKVFIDRINKYGFLNKMAVEAKATKDKKEVYNLIFTTVETTPRLHIFCPYLLKKVLDLEYLEMKLDHVVTGDEKTITISLNYMDMMLVTKMKPSMIEYEVLVGQVSHLKYGHEFTFENNEISFLMAGKSKLQLNEKSYLYKTLYYLSPSYACFKDMTTDYQVEVVDKATGKVDVQFSVLKDTLEMLKLVAMMKPTMIEFEVLIGQVSHLKYIHEFKFENNEISFLMAGKSKLHLHEKSYLYKTLYYL